MKSIVFISLMLIVVVSTFAQDKKAESFSFIAFGDMPYTLPEDYARFENVIKTINEQKSAFTLNVGDIKSSKTPCTDESFTKMFNYYQQFNKPMIYVPGDNEWTDCQKYGEPEDPEERLDALRKMFFKDRNSLGKEKMALTSQSQNPEFKKYVENNRWEFANLSFATFHVVGTNNNFVPTSKNGNQEFYGREKANLAWLEELFTSAKAKGSAAVVIVLHGDMYNPAKDSKEANAFTSFKKKLKDKVVDFKKPVLLINGDSHVFLVDKPIYEEGKLKRAIDNFTRVQVHGENNMHAVKITINPSSIALFQIEELRIPGN
jgi:hypothetical protein